MLAGLRARKGRELAELRLRFMASGIKAAGPCIISECSRVVKSRGMCNTHYRQWHYRQRVLKDPELLTRHRERKAERKTRPECAAADAIQNRRWKLRITFGISLESYQQMLETQRGGCAICGGHDGEKCLAVDHCHTAGRVRGLLCQNCNQALGKMKDDPARLRAAATYLESVLHALPPAPTPDPGASRRGTRGTRAQLTAEQVREIRESPRGTHFDFAKPDAVSRIKLGKIYRWVD